MIKSNAFSKSIKIVIAGSSEGSVGSMISNNERAVSPINVSFIKPD